MLPDLINGPYEVYNSGEESLCQRRGGALIAAVYTPQMLGSKSDKRPAAAKNVGESRNVGSMRSGDRSIRIIFAAFISSKRKCMEPGLSIRDAIAGATLNMFVAMPRLLKNTGRAAGKRSLNL
jgi:hypothetical protein